jgi:UDP-glucuronate 4-epimerase
MNISPKNIYAATKKINEDIANDLSKISNMKMIGLRFFTVYGKFGRPDMFIFKFLNSLLNNKKFYLFNKGNHYRDYTHIDDVVNIIINLIKKKITRKFQIFNICSNNPIDLNKLVKFISNFVNIKPKIIKKKRNSIEVLKTHGDNKKILSFLKIKLTKNIFFELPTIINWYKKNQIWKLKN